jgi:hypothetical protein
VVGGVWKKFEKLLKKKRSSKFFRTGILEVGLRTPLGGGAGGAKYKFALGAEMASYGPADSCQIQHPRINQLIIGKILKSWSCLEEKVLSFFKTFLS